MYLGTASSTAATKWQVGSDDLLPLVLTDTHKLGHTTVLGTAYLRTWYTARKKPCHGQHTLAATAPESETVGQVREQAVVLEMC